MDKKQKTLEALEAFIESQKALLARTQSDIERLRALRSVASEYDDPLEDLAEELADPTFTLQGQDGVAAEIQREIDWSLFKGYDPIGMRTLTGEIKAAQIARSQPSAKQRSPLSPLQQLVKDARRTILDPVFSAWVPPSEDEEDEITPEQARKAAARAQLRALRQRRIGEGGLTISATGGAGVHVRRDVADESADVDLDAEDAPAPLPPFEPKVPVPVEAQYTPAPSRSAPARTRKAPIKPPPQPRPATPAKSKSKRAAPTPVPEAEDADANGEPPNKRKRNQKHNETYKQAWSVSEQHLLERLLDEIPDGEKNRWAKISRAMEGRRTPRQVASRVQKYFEKLKRFGVDIIGNGGGPVAMEDDDPP
ncbi:unnamed protein product [Peniophora sp. CBMAI 1063]|nr:unnamed protein product [Peniophora sp. CBMAI 1063]